MKSSVKVLWIDDDPDRQEDARNMSSVQTHMTVTCIRPEDFPSMEKAWNSATKIPDIFLVDFFLDQHCKEGGEVFPRRGLTMGAIIRESFPERPIYLVSSQETTNGGASLEKWTSAATALFDRILGLKQIQREGKTLLYYDALDYDLIRKAAGRGTASLFNLLHVRNQDARDQLGLVLPDGLKDGVSFPNSDGMGRDSIGFGRWVKHILMAIPGVLYSELHAATFLGMTVEGFRKTTAEFEAARYSGVFSRTYPKVWWSSILRKMVLSHVGAAEVDSLDPREVAPAVFKIAKRYRSKCAVCSKESPETVGMSLQDPSDWRPVHYGCSEPHPGRKKELHFDEPRGFTLNG